MNTEINIDYSKINSLPTGKISDCLQREVLGIVNSQTKNYIPRSNISLVKAGTSISYISVKYKELVIKFQANPEKAKEFMDRLDLVARYTGGVGVHLDTDAIMADLLLIAHVISISVYNLHIPTSLRSFVNGSN